MTELDSNVEWKQWGKDDPLWSVASWADKQRGGSSPWTAEQFYALGASDWVDFERQWAQYGVDRRSCLEIGCGAGRMTKHLAGYFDHVFAVDVSEHMIECAKQGIGVKNVEFSVTDGSRLPHGDRSVNAVFSTHVLQHLDSVEVGFSCFREFFRVLEPGGTIMIHLPVYQFPTDSRVDGVMRFIYGVYRGIARLRAKIRRRTGARLMRDTPYPIQELTRFLAQVGFRNIEIRIFAVVSNGGLHPFVFATR